MSDRLPSENLEGDGMATTHTHSAGPAATSKLLRLSIVIGGLYGAAGVVFLALSAHADTSGMMQTAAHMLLFHAPVLLAMGLLAQIRRIPLLPIAFCLMAAGVLLFSGDLVARAMADAKLFAMAAPAGGILTIAGWIALSASAVRIGPR